MLRFGHNLRQPARCLFQQNAVRIASQGHQPLALGEVQVVPQTIAAQRTATTSAPVMASDSPEGKKGDRKSRDRDRKNKGRDHETKDRDQKSKERDHKSKGRGHQRKSGERKVAGNKKFKKGWPAGQVQFHHQDYDVDFPAKTFYDRLYVPSDAYHTQIHRAFHRYCDAFKCHPRPGMSEEAKIRHRHAKEALDIIGNIMKRRFHDRTNHTGFMRVRPLWDPTSSSKLPTGGKI